MSYQSGSPRRIVFGVTTEASLVLLGGIPSEFIARGWEVHIVVSNPTMAQTKLLEGSNLHSIEMERLPSPFSDSRALCRWYQLLRRLEPTVVSIGTPKASLIGLVAARVAGVPHRVYHLRGLRLETTKGVQRRLLWFFEKITVNSATHVLVVSASLARLCVSLGLADRRKLSLLGKGSSHGVDLEHFSRKESDGRLDQRDKFAESSHEILRLGFLGRFSVDKGALTLIECLKALIKTDIEFLLVVAGPVEAARELGDLQRIGGPRVKVVGPVKNPALCISQFDILLLPTLREGFPNVVLEAGALGIPSVTTNATGAKDSVIDGVTGRTVPVNSPEDFVRAIIQLAEDPALRSRLGNNARDWVRKNFEQATFSRLAADWYESILGYESRESHEK